MHKQRMIPMSAREIIRLGKAEHGGKRFKFWQQYYPDELEAAKVVVLNPPWYDETWRRQFPDPVKFRANKEKLNGR